MPCQLTCACENHGDRSRLVGDHGRQDSGEKDTDGYLGQAPRSRLRNQRAWREPGISARNTTPARTAGDGRPHDGRRWRRADRDGSSISRLPIGSPASRCEPTERRPCSEPHQRYRRGEPYADDRGHNRRTPWTSRFKSGRPHRTQPRRGNCRRPARSNGRCHGRYDHCKAASKSSS